VLTRPREINALTYPQGARARRAPAAPRKEDFMSMVSTMTEAAEKNRGWLSFAAIIMFAVAAFRVVSGIAYLADSNKIADLSRGLFGDNVFWWGIWDLGIAAAAFYAGWSLLSNGAYGRFAGWFWAFLVIFESFTYIAYYPGFAISMIALAVLVIYALTVSGYEEAPFNT
jgi:hypothetical protein